MAGDKTLSRRSMLVGTTTAMAAATAAVPVAANFSGASPTATEDPIVGLLAKFKALEEEAFPLDEASMEAFKRGDQAEYDRLYDASTLLYRQARDTLNELMRRQPVTLEGWAIQAEVLCDCVEEESHAWNDGPWEDGPPQMARRLAAFLRGVAEAGSFKGEA